MFLTLEGAAVALPLLGFTFVVLTAQTLIGFFAEKPR